MSRRCVLQLLRLQWCGATHYPSQPSVARSSAQPQVPRCFHSGSCRPAGGRAPAELRGGGAGEERSRQPAVAGEDLFEQVCGRTRTKDGFTKAVDVFIGRDVRRRGHVEFVYAALKKMPEFGVEKELAVYNKLLDVFPKEVFVPRNFIQRMFNHYPRQQECGVQLLEQMENYGVMPNTETKVLLVQIFGEKGHPMRKYQRIMYWFPKFKNLNPFPVPQELPQDPVELARLTLNRIANDRDANITVYQAPGTEVTESGEERTLPHIIGIQSPAQMELLAQHSSSRPVFVEGPFPLWLRKTCVYYYVLRAEPTPPEDKVEELYDPERCLDYPLQLDLDLDRDLGDLETFDVDELDEGPVFAMCMTSQGDQATLNQWISGLQRLNPVLGRVPTLFRLHAGPRELQAPPHHQQAHADPHTHADPRRAAADSQEPEPTEDEEEEESRQRQTAK